MPQKIYVRKFIKFLLYHIHVSFLLNISIIMALWCLVYIKTFLTQILETFPLLFSLMDQYFQFLVVFLLLTNFLNTSLYLSFTIVLGTSSRVDISLRLSELYTELIRFFLKWYICRFPRIKYRSFIRYGSIHNTK